MRTWESEMKTLKVQRSGSFHQFMNVEREREREREREVGVVLRFYGGAWVGLLLC